MEAHELAPWRRRLTPARLARRLEKRARRAAGQRVDVQNRVDIPKPDSLAISPGGLAFLAGMLFGRRRRAAAAVVVAMLLSPVTLFAQTPTVTVNQPATVIGNHSGLYADGFRLYDNGTKVGADLPASALVRTAGTGNCAGIWTIGPALELLRNGTEVAAGGRGTEIRCVANSVWTLGSDSRWYQLVNTAWVVRPSDPGPGVVLSDGEARFALTLTTRGSHVLEVSAFNLDGEAKASVTVTAKLPTPKTPLNVRIVP